MRATVLLLIAGLLAVPTADATDIASQPLNYSLSTTVKPNIMFILDDSGSMASRFLPEEVNDSNADKPRCNNSTCSSTTKVGLEGNPPWYSAQFNYIYYNPQTTYGPAVNADGTSRQRFGSPWTAVRKDAFGSTDTINLVTGYPEIVYCKNSNDSPTSTTNCRRNGIDTTNPFVYSTASTDGFPNGTGSGAFRYPLTRSGNPFYYTILPREHCTTEDLIDCTLSATPTVTHRFPAVFRWCQRTNEANNTGSAISGNRGSLPSCQRSWSTSHTHARYGRFERTDIVPATATYGNRPNRTDCAAAPNCTYAEEMTNFANWYAYYSTRMQMMKTGVGYAFTQVDGRYRVGLVTINPGSPVASSKYLRIDSFEGTHRTDWYAKLYSQAPNGWTPLREALSRVGRHFAGKTDLINRGMNDDPVQYSCQPNVSLLSTDGYWNKEDGRRLDGTSAIGNTDNVDSGYSTRTAGAFDGGLSGSSNNLSDVAMYYYSTDLRPTGSTGALGTDVSENNVPGTGNDTNPAQHMLTFTIGLGVGGFMKYVPGYETLGSGDFYNIKAGNTGCSWGASNAVCNWPVPPTSDADNPAKIDDLWHAAVNGRGRYVSANDSTSLYDGLVSALSDLKVLVGAAAASATSSPNITTTDNAIFSSTYRTTRWDGELTAQRVDTTTGIVSTTEQWSARTLLNGRVQPASDTRTIHTQVGGTLTPFAWSSLDSATKAYFDNKCAQLSQCASLTAAERSTVDSGQNLVNFLRGQRQHELLYREREYVLGDVVGSRPAFVRDPRRNYGDPVSPSYFDFKTSNASRRAVVYIGGNDGMLHAFDATTGAESWAFVPRTVLPNLHRLAETAYATSHRYFVDGSPTVADVVISTEWRTILIGGLNAGGRGYYALDITDPDSPRFLWEICSDASLCSNSDADIGLSFGNPVVTKRASDGRWVVLLTSGYNNVSPGDGRGYLYVLDASTGAVLNKVATGVGSTTEASGLAKISAFARNPDTDNTTQYVYGGDLLGNVWRFDLGTTLPGVLRLATLKDSAGTAQPITVRPELGQVDSHRVVYFGTGRYLGVSDLQDPATLSPPGNWSYAGSLYAIKDNGTAWGNPRTVGSFVPKTVSTINATRRAVTGGSVNWATESGWYVDFPSTGERVNIDLNLTLGTLVVTTNIPNTNACTAGGDSWIYQLNYRDGQKITTASEAALARPGTLTVGNAIVRLPSGLLKIISTGASGVKETRGLEVGGGATSARRIGWRELSR